MYTRRPRPHHKPPKTITEYLHGYQRAAGMPLSGSAVEPEVVPQLSERELALIRVRNIETLCEECRDILDMGANAERLTAALAGLESNLRYTVEGAASAAGLVAQ